MAEYVNPFGGYASGYNIGSENERANQQGARVARQEDWQNKYINPLDLKERQRQDQLGDYRLPYEKDATNDAAIQLRQKTFSDRLDTATKYAIALRDPTLLNEAGHYANPDYTNRPDDALLRGADYDRNLGLYTTQARAEDQQAQAELRAAQSDYYGGRNDTSTLNTRIRAGAVGAGAAPSPVSRLFPAAAPAATAPAPAQNASPPAPGADPTSMVTPFHQLDPHAQAHVIHYASQLTGHPPEAVAAHIGKQINPAAYSDPYNPGQTADPNGPASYYQQQPGASTTNITTA